MESIKAYIESGVLELYALGALDEPGRREVEAMAAKHPEVSAELSEIENSLQQYAEANAVETPDPLRRRVLNSLVTNLGDDRTFVATAAPQHPEAEDRLIQMHRHRKSSIFYKYAFAASLVLLCLSIAALAAIYRQLQNANGQVLALQIQNSRYASTASFKDEQLDAYRGAYNYKLITLKGTSKSPSSNLTVAWSPVKHKVMLSVQHMDLPANDQRHQYQLWALVKGKPVDLGVFDAANAADSSAKDMMVMKSIAQADAFAVTLEPRGGSANPTLTEMMVMGKL